MSTLAFVAFRFRPWPLLWLAVLCTVAAVSNAVGAQSARNDRGPGNQGIQTYPEPDPETDQKAIEKGEEVLRAEIAVDVSTTVRVVERPKSPTHYDSQVVVVQKGNAVRSYDVGRMIGHQPLRLVHAALIRPDERSGMLVLEFEGGAVGAKEGFAVLRFSDSRIELHTLPLAEFGKIVVFRRNTDVADVWSAVPSDVESAADDKPYSVRRCYWRAKGYECGPEKRQPGLYSPGAIDDPGIEIR